MKTNLNILFRLFTFLLVFSAPACVDLEFDEPPVISEGVDLQPNRTIAELKALYNGTPTTLVEDILIGGVVVADDRSGNFFRTLILQDETGGIEILINLTSAYNFYPIGREIFVRCQGLVLGANNGGMQLGGYTYEEGGALQLGDIIDVRERLLIGRAVGEPAPAIKTISELNQINPAVVGTLIKLENVEFTTADKGKAYADAIGRRSVNRTLTDCSGATIVVRSSGYATFANQLTPDGNGSIVAIYSVFGTTPQLYIREVEDVVMTGDRCTSASGKEELLSIAEIRQAFADGATRGPGNKKIKGVVISDRESGNMDGRSLVLQDGTGGIVVRFKNLHDFALGQEVQVVVSNQELSEYNGLLQINNLSNELALLLGTGTMPTPRETTVNALLANAEAWESTLVLIKGAHLSGGTAYGGSLNLSDASGTVTLFTRSGASFANENLPSGAADVTAIVSQFNTPQLMLRNLDDIKITGGGDAGTILLKDLRALFPGTKTTVPADQKVKGVVISDYTHMNWTDRNLVLQDASGGIVVRFSASHTYGLGKELEIDISGMELSEFRGLLQINNVPLDRVLRTGDGVLPPARTATVKEVMDNRENWESTLVKIGNVSLSGGATYSGSITATDASGAAVLFTRSQASFAGSTLPAGKVTLTAVVSQYDDTQLIIRNLQDIETN